MSVQRQQPRERGIIWTDVVFMASWYLRGRWQAEPINAAIGLAYGFPGAAQQRAPPPVNEQARVFPDAATGLIVHPDSWTDRSRAP
jgi:hypothetical protein